MDLTAMRTRRICNLPLLLQVQKLNKTTMWTWRIYNLSLLLQEKIKKTMQSLYSAKKQQKTFHFSYKYWNKKTMQSLTLH